MPMTDQGRKFFRSEQIVEYPSPIEVICCEACEEPFRRTRDNRSDTWGPRVRQPTDPDGRWQHVFCSKCRDTLHKLDAHVRKIGPERFTKQMHVIYNALFGNDYDR